MQKNKKSQAVNFDRKKFAVDKSKKYRLYFFFLSDDGRLIPTEIYSARYQYELEETDDKIRYARIDERLAENWKRIGNYDRYLSVQEYRNYLKNQNIGGWIQTELDWTDFVKKCSYTHVKSQFSDLQSCLTCGFATCERCKIPIRGTVAYVASHFSIRLDDLKFLIKYTGEEEYVELFYQGKKPKCVLGGVEQ